MKNLLLFVSLMTASISANAAFFQGSSSGTFENPVGAANMQVTGVGTNSFSWGEGAHLGYSWAKNCFFCLPYKQHHYSDPSSLTFNGQSFNTDVDSAFVVGSLYFYNGTIYAGTEATSVDFSLTFDFTAPNSFDETFTYNFALNNTVNPQGDTVKLAAAAPEYFYSFEGNDYYFELLGFSYGGKVFDEIFAKELKGKTVQLLGKFTSIPSEVPLPAAVWLFGSGLMGFMAFRRRAKMNAIA
ncbi:choice-of-anchor K domain-containing protein [Methylophaga lonarensis]|uniref:choice-of-anchor K domain-containing protein n=1 Tax=Methylophaga lonarensis TaxID=999151 RepID=UPI003D28D16F